MLCVETDEGEATRVVERSGHRTLHVELPSGTDVAELMAQLPTDGSLWIRPLDRLLVLDVHPEDDLETISDVLATLQSLGLLKVLVAPPADSVGK